MAINKQPVFTSIPILRSLTFDAPINETSYDLGAINSSSGPQTIFEATDTSGTLIERITVSATGDKINTNVSAKLIYLCIFDYTANSWSLYATAAMPATAVSETVPNPKVEWVFTGGLLIPATWKLGIAVSTNYSTTAQYGDKISVTLEGSSYTAL